MQNFLIDNIFVIFVGHVFFNKQLTFNMYQLCFFLLDHFLLYSLKEDLLQGFLMKNQIKLS